MATKTDAEATFAYITDADFESAAKQLSCDVAAIKAVAAVEGCSGSGLLQPDGFPRFLFEPHIFCRETGGVWSRTHPTVSYKGWGTRPYPKEGPARRAQIKEAMSLNMEAACRSASWGKFQIMGFNCKDAGHSDAHEMLNSFYRDEPAHLVAFVKLLKKWGLADELREHRWAAFARRYNGPGYAKNRYDVKLAQAYHRVGKTGRSGPK